VCLLRGECAPCRVWMSLGDGVQMGEVSKVGDSHTAFGRQKAHRQTPEVGEWAATSTPQARRWDHRPQWVAGGHSVGCVAQAQWQRGPAERRNGITARQHSGLSRPLCIAFSDCHFYPPPLLFSGQTVFGGRHSVALPCTVTTRAQWAHHCARRRKGATVLSPPI